MKISVCLSENFLSELQCLQGQANQTKSTKRAEKCILPHYFEAMPSTKVWQWPLAAWAVAGEQSDVCWLGLVIFWFSMYSISSEKQTKQSQISVEADAPFAVKSFPWWSLWEVQWERRGCVTGAGGISIALLQPNNEGRDGMRESPDIWAFQENHFGLHSCGKHLKNTSDTLIFPLNIPWGAEEGSFNPTVFTGLLFARSCRRW